ncbi:QueT transporter family protein [Lutispora saccharofermentans]|uniref:QueT transporter family protein n=1 Tax=Lutispora saccharofermentans TaxID=3024236 RepID=A0ABT1NGA7_9FIRM|nr:QueT transporter family protein [Lutispora saccharofermentans]MCQ1530272.1 QueT transporter family protein [Lutispora saccharofermentans]
MKKTVFLMQASLIAAIYAAITIALAPISYGQIQVRVAEALTILPAFTPAAIPGLFVGCIVANLYGGGGIIDVVFGSLATLMAAYLSYKMPKKWLVPLPPVVVNGIIVGYILNYLYGLPLLITMGWVAVGQMIACYGFGYPLMKVLEKYEDRIFKSDGSHV